MLRWLLPLLFLALPLAPLRATELLLYTEEGPPLNFTRNGQLSGFAVDLVHELIARTGDQVRIEVVPWTRGYALAREQANVGLFTVARTPEREAQFQWVGPYMRSYDRFYTRKGSNLQVRNLQEARAVRLALPRGWYTLEYLQNQGFDNIFTVTAPDKMMAMFSAGRSDLLAISDTALPSVLAMGNLTPADVEAQFSFMVHDSYLVFSPSTDPAVVARWQAALDQLKQDGSVARLHRQWFNYLPLPEELAKRPVAND